MYKEFFGLEIPPFNLTPDPRFLYLSDHHRDALAQLIYGIRERKGFIALSGEIGSGKTTLCRALLQELNPDSTNVALILNSFLSDIDLLRTVNDEYGLNVESDSRKDFIDALNRFLLEEHEKSKTTILIIDEAQNLDTPVLEQIRMLGNLETENAKLLQIVLIGQPELDDILELPELEQLAQRISVRTHIGPLKKSEVYHYIRHRLTVAGAKVNITLTPPALNRIFHYSGGIPRRINLLCDRALLAAYVAGTFQIDAKMIAIAEKETRGRDPVRARPRSLLPARLPASFLTVVGAFALFAILAMGFWAGLKMAAGPSAPPMPPGADGARSAAYANPAVPPPSVANASTTGSTGPASLAELSAPSAIDLQGDWYWDDDGVARIADPEFSRLAALLTLAMTWQHKVELDIFHGHARDIILNLNLDEILRQKISLQSFATTSTLAQAVRHDLPLIVTIDDPEGRLSPAAALLRVSGDAATLADPRRGVLQLPLHEIQPLVRGARVYYRDPDSFSGLAAGDESGVVSTLRLFLAQRDLWEGPATHVYDENMTRAIERYQERVGVEPTGRIDGPTAAQIASERLIYRPRLSAGGAGGMVSVSDRADPGREDADTGSAVEETGVADSTAETGGEPAPGAGDSEP